MIRGSGSSMSFYRYLCERTTKVSNMESAFREKLTEGENTRGAESRRRTCAVRLAGLA
jgi:hypothetical protein